MVFGDKDKSCPEWASRGDCDTNQDYMLQNCRNSCRAGGVVNGANKLLLSTASFCLHSNATFKSQRLRSSTCSLLSFIHSEEEKKSFRFSQLDICGKKETIQSNEFNAVF